LFTMQIIKENAHRMGASYIQNTAFSTHKERHHTRGYTLVSAEEAQIQLRQHIHARTHTHTHAELSFVVSVSDRNNVISKLTIASDCNVSMPVLHGLDRLHIPEICISSCRTCSSVHIECRTIQKWNHLVVQECMLCISQTRRL